MTGGPNHRDDVLPPLPDPFVLGDGYPWIDALTGGWYAVGVWGRGGGWNLGRWPYVIIAHHDSPNRYALAVYVEGDLDAQTFPDRSGRDTATDRIAAYYWRRYGDGPTDLPERDEDLADHHRGPYPC